MAIPNVTPYSGQKPVPGQDQPTFNQNMSDELDYFNALPAELNTAIDAMNQTATDVDNTKTAAEAEASEAATSATAAAASANYQGDFQSGVTSATAGESYSFNDSTWLCLVNTTTDPAFGSANWRKVVSSYDVKEAEERLLGQGSVLYKGSNGSYVQDGDTVPVGTTHLAVVINGKVEYVAMSPVASGEVSLLTETGAMIGGTHVKLVDSNDNRYTATFKNEGGFSAVDNMIAGRVNGTVGSVVHRVGNIYSTGGTTWECLVDDASSLSDFIPLSKVALSSFGEIGKGDDTSAFLAALTYCNNLVDYTSPNPDISGRCVTLALPSLHLFTTETLPVGVGVKVQGQGSLQTNITKVGGGNAFEFISTINNGLYYPEICDLSIKTDTPKSGAGIICEVAAQWFSSIHDVKIQAFNYGILYRSDGSYYCGMAGNEFSNVLIYDVNVGFQYEGTASKTVWMNEVKFSSFRVIKALIGVYFKYVDGLEAVKFTNCDFNEGSLKYSGTNESNWVNGIRFQNCDIANTEIEHSYFEKIDPKRASTQAEIDGIGAMQSVVLFDYPYQKNVTYYYDSEIIISNAEGSTDYYTCGRDMTNTGAICLIESNVRSLTFNRCAINLNEINLNWYRSTTPPYRNAVEFNDCHGATSLLNACQLDHSFNKLNLANSGKNCSLELGFNDITTNDANHKMVSGSRIDRSLILHGDLTERKTTLLDKMQSNANIIHFSVDAGRVGALGTESDPILATNFSHILDYASNGSVCYVHGTGALRLASVPNLVVRNKSISLILDSTVDMQVNRPSEKAEILLYASSISISGGRLLVYSQSGETPGNMFKVMDDSCSIRLTNCTIGNVNQTLPPTPYVIAGSATGGEVCKLSLHNTVSTVALSGIVDLDNGLSFEYPTGFNYNLTNIGSLFFS